MEKRLILVTNDDGIMSPGIEVLARVAEEFGDVHVVAPEIEQSGVSHAITLTRPLRPRSVRNNWTALDGTPTDCVFIGSNHILPRKPDWVLSGVNRGPNLGCDVIYSGTVGGAMEGTIQGMSSVAFSLVSRDDFPFDWARSRIRAVLESIERDGVPPGVMLNVNIPDPSVAAPSGFRVTRLGKRQYSNDIITRTDPRGVEYLWIGGSRITYETSSDADTGAVFEGYVSITPIRPDMMARAAIDAISAYHWEICGDRD